MPEATFQSEPAAFAHWGHEAALHGRAEAADASRAADAAITAEYGSCKYDALEEAGRLAWYQTAVMHIRAHCPDADLRPPDVIVVGDEVTIDRPGDLVPRPVNPDGHALAVEGGVERTGAAARNQGEA